MSTDNTCPVCGLREIPTDDQWWLDNKEFRCPTCWSSIHLSGLQQFRLSMWDSIVGWGIGASLITLGLGLIIFLPVFILFKILFATSSKFKVVERGSPPG